MARVLIMHGWTNRRAEGNWHRWLVSQLRHQGHQVLYPQFPSTDNPTLEDWQDLLLAELDLLEEAGPGESIVIGHSLGCINFIHAAVDGKIKNWTIGATIPMGAATIRTGYSQWNGNGAEGQKDDNKFGLGVKYDLSKRTFIYTDVATQTRKNNTGTRPDRDNTKVTSFDLGVAHSF